MILTRSLYIQTASNLNRSRENKKSTTHRELAGKGRSLNRTIKLRLEPPGLLNLKAITRGGGGAAATAQEIGCCTHTSNCSSSSSSTRRDDAAATFAGARRSFDFD